MMMANKLSLSTKIFGILGIFFLVALIAIGLTLHASWRLEGVAAAINDMGSQRMRTERLAFLLSAIDQRLPAITEVAAAAEIDRLERVQKALETGDSRRPMFLPEQLGIHRAASDLHDRWRRHVRPLLAEFLSTSDADRRHAIVQEYALRADSFIREINQLIDLMERNYADSTNLLRAYQVMLVLLAVIGTSILTLYSLILIVRPMRALQEGIQRMTADDFSVRLRVESNDEFGELANGFNLMANHLQDLYQTLEQRVESKTQSLEEKNQELATLYEITAFLNEPMSTEALCNGFLHRTLRAIGADGGTLRLYAEKDQELYLLAHEGVSNEFAQREASLQCGECVCGEAVSIDGSIETDVREAAARLPLAYCKQEGIRTVAAFPIVYDRRVIGVYTLMFRLPRKLTPSERHLLETLGQNLAVTVENQRLQASEKELAVAGERNLMAQELHDSIAQGLAFLNIQIQLMSESLRQGKQEEARETLARIREGVQESYDDVRELLVHFRTRVEPEGLDTAVAKVLKKLEAQSGIATTLVVSGKGLSLPHDEESQALHIIQEALSNARKHSGAKSLEVRLERQPEKLTVTITDDGRGFSPERETDPLTEHQHVGLKIMQERAQRIGGVCQVHSVPGKGTTVMLTLPPITARPL
ncbi:ATP-binding protein [Denitratisoma sp. DHT3]|uniref:ATP-binding protein n=1 Tax=Denitratisoma sp. DHT3 TaxID=1981880 RepID=UPI0016491CB8|nr:ATP-binding protein [Denitratisoma sp. DHT3]